MRFASITQRLQGLGSDKWHVHIEGKRRLAAGEPMLMLSIGEPDFKTPQAIVDVATERLRVGLPLIRPSPRARSSPNSASSGSASRSLIHLRS